MTAGNRSVAHSAKRGTRDTGPSAWFSGIAAYASTAATPTPRGRTSLTRSRFGARTRNRMRGAVCLVAADRDDGESGQLA